SGRVVHVLGGAKGKGDKQAFLVEVHDGALQVGGGFYGINAAQIRLQRLNALTVDSLLVHAGAVEVADELFDRAGRSFGRTARGIVENFFENVFGGFAGAPALASAHHGIWNGIIGA